MNAPVVVTVLGAGSASESAAVVHNIGWTLVDLGRQVLLVDFDPEVRLSSAILAPSTLDRCWFASERGRGVMRGLWPLLDDALPHATTFDVVPARDEIDASVEFLLDDETDPERHWPAPDGPRLVVGDPALVRIEMALQHARVVARRQGLNAAVHDLLRRTAPGADVVLIDAGSGIGTLAQLAFSVADAVLLAVSNEGPARRRLAGLEAVFETWLEVLEAPHRPTVCGHAIVVTSALGRRRPHHLPEAQWLARHAASVAPLAELLYIRPLQSVARLARKPICALSLADGGARSLVQDVIACRQEFEGLTRALAAQVGLALRPPYPSPRSA